MFSRLSYRSLIVSVFIFMCIFGFWRPNATMALGNNPPSIPVVGSINGTWFSHLDFMSWKGADTWAMVDCAYAFEAQMDAMLMKHYKYTYPTFDDDGNPITADYYEFNAKCSDKGIIDLDAGNYTYKNTPIMGTQPEGGVVITGQCESAEFLDGLQDSDQVIPVGSRLVSFEGKTYFMSAPNYLMEGWFFEITGDINSWYICNHKGIYKLQQEGKLPRTELGSIQNDIDVEKLIADNKIIVIQQW